MTQRKVIHIDCDCFFAAVEMRDNPKLRQLPIAIGGHSRRRGVIATCNYPARQFGVRSAMATGLAQKMCPNLILLPGNMARYRQASEQVMAILRGYANEFEQVSIDEAYLEVPANSCATAIAEAIRRDVARQVGITVSAGVASNKLLAKIASDWNKPDGIKVIKPQHIDAFMSELPVGKIPGVGKAMQAKLAQLNIHSCGDVQQWSLNELLRRFGRMGLSLYQRSRGIDERKLQNQRLRKSISVERTYAEDLSTNDACIEQLPQLWQQWQQRLERAGLQAHGLTPFVKIKFADFRQTTLADSRLLATESSFEKLFQLALQRHQQPVRLLGIGGKCLAEDSRQLPLF